MLNNISFKPIYNLSKRFLFVFYIKYCFLFLRLSDRFILILNKKIKNKKMTTYLEVIMPFGGIDYINFLKKRFNVKILKPNTKKIPSLLFFTGGADISPSMYGETKGSYTNINEERDKVDFKLATKKWGVLRTIPKLGICRGAQFLCALNGGNLIQHVAGHAIGGSHSITWNFPFMAEEYISEMTSTHHQMMYPFNLYKIDYEIIAYSTNFRSSIYLRENDENLSICKGFLEPEIVYFNKYKSLAIQGHPEFKHCAKETVQRSLDIIETKLNLTRFVKKNILKERKHKSIIEDLATSF